MPGNGKLHYPQIQERSGRRTYTQEERPRKRIPALPVFHRLRPPDKHHRIGRSNQWWRNPTGLKDTRRFPLVAPSCALLFPSCGIRVVVEALPKSPRPVPFRQFAPSWAVCKNPPFSPTAAPYPVTIVLSPTR